VTKTATLLGVSKATVSKVMSVYTDHGKTTAAKRNSGQKSTMTERDSHMSRPSRCSLHQAEFTFGEHPRKPTIQNAWFQQ
jgi:hypothetical protein